nr:hypothetical protein [Tanacetum cinerariifolium]
MRKAFCMSVSTVNMKKSLKQLKLKEVEDHANRVTKREDIKCTSIHNARQKVKASKRVDNMAAKDSCVGFKHKKQRICNHKSD